MEEMEKALPEVTPEIPEQKPRKKKNGNLFVLRLVSYLLVAVLASCLTLAGQYLKKDNISFDGSFQPSKLDELQQVIDQYYIGDADTTYMGDMAAAAMVAATGDRWSYYIPAADMQAHTEQKENAYVGIGVTIIILENDQGFEIQKVEPNSPAKEGGMIPGDVIVGVNGDAITQLGSTEASNRIRGQEGTTVDITYLRDGQEHTVTLTRKRILTQVVSGYMATDKIGYVKINNFDDRCSKETIAMIEALEEQGAEGFIFDVRFNPGGYKHELVKLLDYLLPKGVLFRSEDYRGVTDEDMSDAACKDFPIAVLVNSDSYSAAEFFAAALVEYEYAFTVGQNTTGKGYFQTTIPLSDGSAVNISIGKYYTPKGVSLAEVGGIAVDIPVEIDEETAAMLYSELLTPEEDEQLQAAIAALAEQMGN